MIPTTSKPSLPPGLSLAIDRMRIIQDVFSGQGIPSQPAPRPESPYYNKKLAAQYGIRHESCQQVLDEAGLVGVMPKGWRLLPDGRTLKLTLDAVMTEHRETENGAEQLACCGALRRK